MNKADRIQRHRGIGKRRVLHVDDSWNRRGEVTQDRGKATGSSKGQTGHHLCCHRNKRMVAGVAQNPETYSVSVGKRAE